MPWTMFVDCTVTDMDLSSSQTDAASPAGFVDQLRKGPAL